MTSSAKGPPMPPPPDKKSLLARLPKVDLVLAHPAVAGLRGEAPLTLLKAAVRATVERLREEVKAGRVKDAAALSVEAAAEAARPAGPLGGREEAVGPGDLPGLRGGVQGGGHAGMIAIHKVIASLVRRR